MGEGRGQSLPTQADLRFPSSGNGIRCSLRLLLRPPPHRKLAGSLMNLPPLMQNSLPPPPRTEHVGALLFCVRLKFSELMSWLYKFTMADLGHRGCKWIIKERLNEQL